MSPSPPGDGAPTRVQMCGSGRCPADAPTPSVTARPRPMCRITRVTGDHAPSDSHNAKFWKVYILIGIKFTATHNGGYRSMRSGSALLNVTHGAWRWAGAAPHHGAPSACEGWMFLCPGTGGSTDEV